MSYCEKTLKLRTNHLQTLPFNLTQTPFLCVNRLYIYSRYPGIYVGDFKTID